MAQLSRHRLGKLSLGVEFSHIVGIENSLVGALARSAEGPAAGLSARR